MGKSFWLDLSVPEACMHFRMETAMQWDLKWLHFNGTFGQDLEGLFKDVELKYRK